MKRPDHVSAYGAHDRPKIVETDSKKEIKAALLRFVEPQKMSAEHYQKKCNFSKFSTICYLCGRLMLENAKSVKKTAFLPCLMSWQ
ncbi:MAG: hypothetical protein ACK4NS_09035 [Saprospiraceae bacterium]